MKSSLKDIFSTLEYKNIQWIEALIYGLFVCLGIQLIILLLESTTGSSEYLDLALIITYVSFICYLGYFGLQQPPIQVQHINAETLNTERITISEKRKYMSDAEVKEVSHKMDAVFFAEKLYLDEELTLNKLALLLETTDKKLSYYLNNHLQINFHDFINKYRVAAFKEKVANKENAHLSLLGIAYDSGFKSKSSFNRIFKKETGLSPSAYQKSL